MPAKSFDVQVKLRGEERKQDMGVWAGRKKRMNRGCKLLLYIVTLEEFIQVIFVNLGFNGVLRG